MGNLPSQAIVLAAGLGTRLLPLTRKSPKPILPVGGVPILLFNLLLLKKIGIRDVTINLHHLPERIRSLFKNGKQLGLKLRYSYEPKILGTAGGIAQALATMKNAPTFVLNGDILCDLDLDKVARQHQHSGAIATLACVPHHKAKVSSFVESDTQQRIHRIAGAPPTNSKNLSKLIFSGVHLLDPKIFLNYPRHRFGCVVRQVYQPALARGELLESYLHPGSWWDLGNLEELQNIDQRLWRGELSANILKLWDEVSNWYNKSLRHREKSY